MSHLKNTVSSSVNVNQLELLIALIFMGFPLCQAESNSLSQNWQPVAACKPTVILLFTNFLTEYFFCS